MALRLRSDAVGFAELRGFVERACRAVVPDAAESCIAAVALALHETVRNVAEHAYAPVAPGAIELEAAGRAGTLVLRVVHDGAPFDRAAVPAPSFDGSREGGFGLFLVESAVDRVSYTCTAGGRQLVRLEKRIERAARGPEEEPWPRT